MDDQASLPPDDDPAAADARARMVVTQIAANGVRDAAVLAAMRAEPRHLYVPADLRGQAYHDRPLPIGHGQTISQPFIVALMSALVRPRPEDRALEVGTGSGYQAAILARLVRHVYSLEIVGALAEEARARLAALGHSNVSVRTADGYRGWEEEAPFDVIVSAAAPEEIPDALVAQLAPGGRMVVPVGRLDDVQHLMLVERQPSGEIATRAVAPVRFVPMVRGKPSPPTA
jgi:protein-L-isoaspartate(D-aspartate) O-methyltransferase